MVLRLLSTLIGGPHWTIESIKHYQTVLFLWVLTN